MLKNLLAKFNGMKATEQFALIMLVVIAISSVAFVFNYIGNQIEIENSIPLEDKLEEITNEYWEDYHVTTEYGETEKEVKHFYQTEDGDTIIIYEHVIMPSFADVDEYIKDYETSITLEDLDEAQINQIEYAIEQEIENLAN